MIKKTQVLIGILSLTLALGITWWMVQAQPLEAPEASSYEEIANLDANAESVPRLNIELPFYSQAPYGNWDNPWQETCEEASILLVANLYLDLQLDTEQFNQGLLDLVDWQMNAWGAYEHSDVNQTVQMLEENFGLEAKIQTDPSFEDLQKSIQKGHLIVAPFAGQALGNPYFSGEGPIYHMLVIKGYDTEKGHVVTHDVGTRRGADFVYSWDTIENALHDWHDESIWEGTPQWIEVIPPSSI